MEMRLIMERTSSDNFMVPGPVGSLQNSDKEKLFTEIMIKSDAKYRKELDEVSICKEVASLRLLLQSIFVLRYWNKLLGICVVTWACVVVLGGFLGNIGRREFIRVSFLLLMYALCLSYTTSWPYMVNRLSDVALYFTEEERDYRVSPPPRSFLYSKVPIQVGGRVFFVFTCSTSLVSTVFSTIISFKQAPKYNLTISESEHAALKIFYLLVIVNSLIADIQLLLLFHSFIAFKGVFKWPGTRSICAVTFFSRANTTCQGKDYLRSREVELLDFVYQMMSDECGGAMERLHVDRLHALHSLCQDMVPYVYHHPQGFEATLAAMESSDYTVQEAAALMVGFLVHLESEMVKRGAPSLLCSQEAIVTKLTDLGMGTGQVKGPRRDAALWSLLKLARHDQRALIQVSAFRENLIKVACTVGLGAQYGSEDHRPSLDILSAISKNEDSRNVLLQSVDDELGRARVEKAVARAMQNTPAPKDLELKNPLSEGLKVDGRLFFWLYMWIIVSGVILGWATVFGFKAVLRDTGHNGQS